MVNAYTKTAKEQHQKGLSDAGHAHAPRQTDEHGDAKNVLNGWQVDTKHDAQVGLKTIIKKAKLGKNIKLNKLCHYKYIFVLKPKKIKKS